MDMNRQRREVLETAGPFPLKILGLDRSTRLKIKPFAYDITSILISRFPGLKLVNLTVSAVRRSLFAGHVRRLEQFKRRGFRSSASKADTKYQSIMRFVANASSFSILIREDTHLNNRHLPHTRFFSQKHNNIKKEKKVRPLSLLLFFDLLCVCGAEEENSYRHRNK